MDNKNIKWYMVTTISGKEEKVIESLTNRVKSENLEGIIEKFKLIKVPHITPKELEKKQNGEEFKTRERNLFPGYIFIKMEMTNDAWFIVRNTQYVTGLVGSSGQRAKPTPVSNLEMRKMERNAKKYKEDFEAGKIISPFEVGMMVEVLDGPSKGQAGKIIEVDIPNEKVVVEIEIFERMTPTTFEFKLLKVK